MNMSKNTSLFNQQQVKVVIRLKPDQTQSKNTKCAYLSHVPGQLVLESSTKRQYFQFDHVASQKSSQSQIYENLGVDAVNAVFNGYNCCLFAYGQTGAGKTYSIIGSLPQLLKDCLAQSRGLLPRLLESLLQKKTTDTIFLCSYLQIYNEQIFDLLSSQKHTHLLREDIRRGVFVQGIKERKIQDYRSALQLLFAGDKTKKIAATQMNNESSRSHTIFTIYFQKKTDGKMLKSKLHVIDLAGSQKAKQTLAEGERLKQGCNINKSLLVLGNVINSLVQSAKKKKHIPYRDSKLTLFLKDSLGGNSITKLLANINCDKQYFGDTLSTLLFAKKAKILKNKVEINEEINDNFDSLRQQVKKLRQQLAQARYIRLQTQYSNKQTENDQRQSKQNVKIIDILQKNQKHYKSLIQILQEQIKYHNIQLSSFSNKKFQNKKKHHFKEILLSLPCFSNIFKQNLQLKSKINNYDEKSFQNTQINDTSIFQNNENNFGIQKNLSSSNTYDQSDITKIIQKYEIIINELIQNFNNKLIQIQEHYKNLQQQIKLKDQIIKQFINRQNMPDVRKLHNQNEVLQLNIMNLQNQMKQMQKKQHFIQLKAKAIQQEDNDQMQQLIDKIKQKLQQIKDQAHRQSLQIDKQIFQMTQIIKKQQLNNIKQYKSQQNQVQLIENQRKKLNITQLKFQMTQQKIYIRQLSSQIQQLKSKLNFYLSQHQQS